MALLRLLWASDSSSAVKYKNYTFPTRLYVFHYLFAFDPFFSQPLRS